MIPLFLEQHGPNQWEILFCFGERGINRVLILVIIISAVFSIPTTSTFVTSRGLKIDADSLFHHVSIEVPAESTRYRKRHEGKTIYKKSVHLYLADTIGTLGKPLSLTLIQNDQLISPDYVYIQGTQANTVDGIRKSPPDNCFYHGNVTTYPNSLVAHGMIEFSPAERFTIHALSAHHNKTNSNPTFTRALSGRSHILIREQASTSHTDQDTTHPSSRPSSCFVVEPPGVKKTNPINSEILPFIDFKTNLLAIGEQNSNIYRPENMQQAAELLLINDYQRYLQWGPELVELSTIEIINTAAAIYRQSPVLPTGYTLSIMIAGIYTATEPIWFPENVTTVQANDLLYNICDWRSNMKSTQPNSVFERADVVHLLSGRVFATDNDPNPSLTNPTLLGLGYTGAMCSSYSCGITYTSRTSGIGNMAATVAHELGHNFGSSHDSTDNSCPSEGFIMAAYGCASCANYPTTFSSCSQSQISDWFSDGGRTTFGGPQCLNNLPSLCGNGIVDIGEACDSGNTQLGSACCTPNCQLRPNAKCDSSNGRCCDGNTCMYRAMGTECRAQGQGQSLSSSCDIGDVCSGTSAKCPDVYLANGSLCTTSNHGPGTCLNGKCTNRALQCSEYKFEWSASCEVNGSACELKCQNDNRCINISSAVPNSPKYNVTDFAWCVPPSPAPGVFTCNSGQCAVRMPRIVLGMGAYAQVTSVSSSTVNSLTDPLTETTVTITTVTNPTSATSSSSTTIIGRVTGSLTEATVPTSTDTNSTSAASSLRIPPAHSDFSDLLKLLRINPYVLTLVAPEIDPDSARQLFDYAGILLVRNLPVGTDIGIDFSEWKVGPRFGGLKFVPPGLHFLHYSVNQNKSTDLHPDKVKDRLVEFRCGFFLRIAQGQVIVFDWNQVTEELVLVLDADLIQRLKRNVKELDRYLGPYPIDSSANMHAWPRLTNFITDNILSKVLPTPHTGVHYLSSMMESNQISDYSMRQAHVNPVSLNPSSTSTLHFTMFDLRRSWDSQQSRTDPTLVTKYSIDKSWLLQATFCLDYVENFSQLLGEFQLSFLCILVGHNYEGFEQWKRIMHLVCQSTEAITSYPKLFTSFLYVVLDQLTECPPDFFTDLLTSDNFVFKLLSQLMNAILHPDSEAPKRPKKLVEAIHRICQFCGNKFAVSLAFSDADREEEEEGEYAPLLVIL